MTIIVTQSNAANFPSIPADTTTPGGAVLPGVYEAWPLGAPWTIDLTFTGRYEDATTGQLVNVPVTDHTIVADPNNLFEFAEVNHTKLSGNSHRVFGPAVNAFRDSYYMFQLQHTDAIFGKDANGNVIELDPIVLPNQNDPNLTIKDEDFVMPPRPKGEVEIIDTGATGGVISVSLPRYFTRKLQPNTELPWVTFVTFKEPSVQQVTLGFDVRCTYTVPLTGAVTETIRINQTIYFSYDLVMQYIAIISEQRRIE